MINFRENLERDLGSSCSKADQVSYLETFANAAYTTNNVEPLFQRNNRLKIHSYQFCQLQSWSFAIFHDVTNCSFARNSSVQRLNIDLYAFVIATHKQHLEASKKNKIPT